MPPTETQDKFNDYQSKKPNIETLKRRLDLKIDEWDAISFFKGITSGIYTTDIIKFVPSLKYPVSEYEMHPAGMGHKFIYLTTGREGIVREEFTLGDPVHVLLNFIKSGEQGFLLKKCPQSIEMANNIVEHAQMTARVMNVMLRANLAKKV